jgi:hypothetical protein
MIGTGPGGLSLGKQVGQNFEGDVRIELCVPRAIHLAHATEADGRHDLVAAKPSASGERHRSDRQIHHVCDFRPTGAPTEMPK